MNTKASKKALNTDGTEYFRNNYMYKYIYTVNRRHWRVRYSIYIYTYFNIDDIHFQLRRDDGQSFFKMHEFLIF